MMARKEKQKVELRPEQALLHPIWVAALGILIVNDHLLKESAMAGAVTGKLSDFAGLVVAPVLLAAILRLDSRKKVWAAGASVFGVFAAINVSVTAASLWDAGMSMVWPWVTTVDPTDLIAIPFAAGILALLLPAMERASTKRGARLAQAGLATVAGLASMATSQPPPNCEFNDDCFVEETLIQSRVSLLNRTHELHAFRISSLRDDIRVDCSEMERDPNAVLGRGAFGSATLWFVQSGQEIALTDGTVDEWSGQSIDNPNRSCHATLVESETAPDILVVWNDNFSQRTFAFDADIPKEIKISEGTVVLEADYSRTPPEEIKDYRMRSECGSRAENCAEETLAPLAEIPTGARYSWSSRGPNDGTFHHPRPAEQFDRIFDPEPFCQTPGPGEGLEWTTPPGDSFEIVGFEEGLDGCHTFEWTNFVQVESADWLICAPVDSLQALVPAEDVTVEIDDVRLIGAIAQNSSDQDPTYSGLLIAAARRDPDGNLLERQTIYLTRGFGLPPEAQFDFSLERREGCEAEVLECGTARLPADMEVLGYETILRPGDSATIGDVVERRIHLVRATLNPVYNQTCDASMTAVTPPDDDSLSYIETVVIRPQ